MKRKIIRIDEEKCDGCGLCAKACAEGAIQIVDGKARLVSESYCDGLGNCLGECPQDAISIEEREAEAFDEEAVNEHLKREEEEKEKNRRGDRPEGRSPEGRSPCMSSRLASFPHLMDPGEPIAEASSSRLGHWPVQISLVPAIAPFLADADLVIAADCVAYAVGDFHERYLGDRAVLVGCPKLDDLDEYRQKLEAIFAQAKPRSITVVKMEVPCCLGIAMIVQEARDAALPDMPIEIHTVGTKGEILRKVLPPLPESDEREGK